MNKLKEFFPYALKPKNDFISLILILIGYCLMGIAVVLFLELFARIPIVNIVCDIIQFVITVYVFAGMVIAVLDYFKIIK